MVMGRLYGRHDLFISRRICACSQPKGHVYARQCGLCQNEAYRRLHRMNQWLFKRASAVAYARRLRDRAPSLFERWDQCPCTGASHAAHDAIWSRTRSDRHKRPYYRLCRSCEMQALDELVARRQWPEDLTVYAGAT